VDCGIASIAEAEEARRLGLELIITDHHEFKDQLPNASALVHPRLPGGSYPFGDLSGSGVAFKLAWMLCQRVSGGNRVTPQLREFLLNSLALAALGMVADWVPLHDENRIIVRHGLARLGQSPSVGLKALLEAAGLGEKTDLSATDVSFALAPRLNAAGRLGCARLVVELLTTSQRPRAVELARFLDHQNGQRQQIERRILDEAHELASAYDLASTPALVLARTDWHAGVIGIVAGRLAEHYARPVLLIAAREDAPACQGSGRSVPGFLLHKALHACGDGLISHGGHATAVGFKIYHRLIDQLRERFCAYASQNLPAGPATARLVIDAEVTLSMLTPGLVAALDRLEPYGAGNPRPKFLAGPLQVVGTPRRVGKGERHLQFRVQQQQAVISAIAFNLANRTEELMSSGGQCFLVFTPGFNEWQGRRTIQIEVTDFQARAKPRLE
jgi:single-stranded-DNA-specific exonuclease